MRKVWVKILFVVLLSMGIQLVGKSAATVAAVADAEHLWNIA